MYKGSDKGFTTQQLFLLISFLLISSNILLAANPWVHTFTPTRELYVSPNGNGNGTQGSPMSFNNAINNAQPGDLYWMTQGTYSGSFIMANDGTSSKPIVYRALPDNEVKVVGGIRVMGDYIWIWGMEFTDPNGSCKDFDGVLSVNSRGVHVINNVLHDPSTNKNTATAWEQPGQIIYGNIFYNGRHNLYAQNDFAANGYKYVVNNMFMDPLTKVSNNAQNLQVYGEAGEISGFHIENNIFVNGRVLLGGKSPADNEVVIHNYNYNSKMQFGYDAPAQVKAQYNYMGRSHFDLKWFWGTGETQYSPTQPNIITNNEVYYPPSWLLHMEFRTASYYSSGLCYGCPKIKSSDVIDNNVYSAPFKGYFYADNDNEENVTFSEWKASSAAAGNGFDANSTIVSGPPGNKIVLIPNEYEPGRGHLAIFNWSKSANITVDLSSVVASGSSFKILKAKSTTGSPVVQGTYTGPVSIPMSGDEYGNYLVTSSGGAPVTDTTPPETSITSSFCGNTVSTTSVTGAWTGTDDITSAGNLQYSYSLDGGTGSSYATATSHMFNNLSNGSHDFTVKAKDQAGNVDETSASCTFSVDASDVTAPVISNIETSGIVLANATISWDTNEASDTQVEYGTSACPCSTNSAHGTSLTTAHSVTLTGLASGTTYHYRVKSRDDAGNLAVSMDLTFSTGVDNPVGKNYTCMEAEAALIASSLEIEKDSSASQKRFLVATATDAGTASYNIQIPKSGEYVVWTRAIADNGEEDSFYVRADGGAEDIFDVAYGHWSSKWQWNAVNGRGGTNTQGLVNPRKFNLSSGSHNIVFRGREVNTRMDLIIVTNDLSFQPPDTFAGILSKVKAKKLEPTYAQIKWKTLALANAQVEYGTSTTYGTVTPLVPEMIEKHKFELTGLVPNTEYHFRVRSTDAQGNTYVSGDNVFLTPSQ